MMNNENIFHSMTTRPIPPPLTECGRAGGSRIGGGHLPRVLALAFTAGPRASTGEVGGERRRG